MRPWTPLGLTIALAAVTAIASPADEPKAVIPSAEARDHVDETGTFEMLVRSSRDYEPRKVYYLNSEDNYRDEKNLAVVIAYDDDEAFKKAGIDDPAAYYKGKTLRVTGKVIHEANQTRIHVTGPKQIEVMAASKDKP